MPSSCGGDTLSTQILRLRFVQRCGNIAFAIESRLGASGGFSWSLDVSVRVVVQRLVAIVVVLLQGSLALLGSGGLHALPGHQCSHVHGPVDQPKAEPVHRCGHRHQLHGSVHCHSPAEHREPIAPAPADDDCLVCHLFLMGAIASLPPILEVSIEAVPEPAPVAVAPTHVSVAAGPVSARGPPLA